MMVAKVKSDRIADSVRDFSFSKKGLDMICGVRYNGSMLIAG